MLHRSFIYASPRSVKRVQKLGVWCSSARGKKARVLGSKLGVGLDRRDLGQGIPQDLCDFLVLVLATENVVHRSTNIVSSLSSTKFEELYRSLPPHFASVEELTYLF